MKVKVVCAAIMPNNPEVGGCTVRFEPHVQQRIVEIEVDGREKKKRIKRKRKITEVFLDEVNGQVWKDVGRAVMRCEFMNISEGAFEEGEIYVLNISKE